MLPLETNSHFVVRVGPDSETDGVGRRFVRSDVGSGSDEDSMDEDTASLNDKEPMEKKKTERTYRPEVDGLRTVAVLPVVLYHFGMGFPGGYTGVDVFFVISGYLITRLLRKHLAGDKAKDYLPTFWMRRARRLMPASLLVTAAVLVALQYLLVQSVFSQAIDQAFSSLLWHTNIFFYLEDDAAGGAYSLAPVNSIRPFLHFWSLCVEEQFYLVLPVLMFVCGRKYDLALLMITFVASLVASSVLVFNGGVNFAFYMLPTRAWEMAMGGLLTFLHVHDKYHTALGAVGLVMIFVSYFSYTHHTPFPGVSALLPCTGAALVILGDSDGGVVNKALSISPMLYIGKLSYSLYLWHWPVYVILTLAVPSSTYNENGVPVRALSPFVSGVGLVLSFVFAVFAYDNVETVWRSPKRVADKIFYPVIFLAWAGLLAYTIAFKTHAFGGLEWLYPVGTPPVADVPPAGTFLNQSYYVSPENMDIGNMVNTPNYQWWVHDFLQTLDGSDKVDVVMLGSSKCTQVTEPLIELAQEYNLNLGFLCRVYSGHEIFGTPYTEFDNLLMNKIAQWQPRLIVWLGSFKAHAYNDVDKVVGDLRVSGAKILMVEETPIPTFGSFDMKSELVAIYRGFQEANLDFLAEMDGVRRFGVIDKFVSHVNDTTKVEAMETWDLFTDKNNNILMVDPHTKYLAYSDPYHLTEVGVRRLIPGFRAAFEAL